MFKIVNMLFWYPSYHQESKTKQKKKIKINQKVVKIFNWIVLTNLGSGNRRDTHRTKLKKKNINCKKNLLKKQSERRPNLHTCSSNLEHFPLKSLTFPLRLNIFSSEIYPEINCTLKPYIYTLKWKGNLWKTGCEKLDGVYKSRLS